MRIDGRLTRLESRRKPNHDAYERYERERLEAMTEGQLLQHIARGLTLFEGWDDAPYADDIIRQVDALTAAGDIAGATALVNEKWEKLNLTEV
jgi:hypothetical protein